MAHKPCAPRLAHVLCATAEGYRWLKRNIRPSWATEAPGGGFLITDETRWALALQAAGGKEVP